MLRKQNVCSQIHAGSAYLPGKRSRNQLPQLLSQKSLRLQVAGIQPATLQTAAHQRAVDVTDQVAHPLIRGIWIPGECLPPALETGIAAISSTGILLQHTIPHHQVRADDYTDRVHIKSLAGVHATHLIHASGADDPGVALR